LIKRRNQAQAKLNPAPKGARPARAAASAGPHTEQLVCLLCGATFERVVVKGRKPHLCPDCRAKGNDATAQEAPPNINDALAQDVLANSNDALAQDIPP